MIKLAALSIKPMNVHHLELFYYVAKHGGITEAVRKIPYGIQQPAVSGQIAQLEESLGVTLFQRRPFQLSPAGEKLFEFIQPFFSKLDAVESELQGGTARSIRIGASTVVLREHFPALLQNVRKKFPNLKIGLREGHQPELEILLMKDEIDLAVTLVEKKSAPGINSLPLLELPLVLLVEKNSKLADASQLWRLDKIEEPLICLRAFETISKSFQQSLAKLEVDWFPSVEVSSLELIETYVANGLGIGVSVSIPKGNISSKLRRIPLPGFPPVVIGALWRGKKNPLLETVLAELERRAKSLI